MKQLIRPTPDIPCTAGWCLAYVNEAFGVPKKYGSATAAWFGSATKHYDRNFPAGCWVPVWYALAGNPLGHVVLLAPDGSCYSTSDYSGRPYHHPSLAHLEWFYAYYGLPLTYRGWTEDVEDTRVLTAPAIIPQATIIKKDWFDMASQDDLYKVTTKAIWETLEGGRATERLQDIIAATPMPSVDGKLWPLAAHMKGTAIRTVQTLAELEVLKDLVKQVLEGQAVDVDYDRLQQIFDRSLEQGTLKVQLDFQQALPAPQAPVAEGEAPVV